MQYPLIDQPWRQISEPRCSSLAIIHRKLAQIEHLSAVVRALPGVIDADELFEHGQLNRSLHDCLVQLERPANAQAYAAYRRNYRRASQKMAEIELLIDDELTGLAL